MRPDISSIRDEDLKRMASNMRAIDALEFDLIGGGKPRMDSLEHLRQRSRYARAGCIDGELVALFGVISPTVLSTSGSPWMCATNAVNESPKVRRAIVEHTRGQLANMAAGFDRLWNVVSAENDIAIRWLKWAGFDFDGRQFDVGGHQFLYFSMEN